jgi:hypothetical protein
VSKSWIDEIIESASPKAARAVYWAGEVEFLAATESDITGRTVKLRTLRGPEEFGSPNPFALATRKRNGFAGTFFEMTLSLLAGAEGYEEPRSHSTVLLNWSDGPKGATITLKVSDEQLLHPFMFCKRPSAGVLGTRWMAVFVELTDDEQPVDQEKAQFTIRDSRIENDPFVQAGLQDDARHPHPYGVVAKLAKPMSYAQNAAILMQAPAFAMYLQERVDGNRQWDVDSIDTWLKAKLGIKSKTELNEPGTARTAFDAIKSNYIDWSGRSQYSKI